MAFTSITLQNTILKNAVILENGVRVRLLLLSNTVRKYTVRKPARRLISYTSAVPQHGSTRTTITFYI